MRAALVCALLGLSCGTEKVIHRGDVAECGGCHTQQYEQWSRSRHASSGESEVFRALLPQVEARWGKVARARCETCHQPGHAGDQTIGCASCHLAVGNREDANGALVVNVEAAVAGPGENTRAPHEVTPRRFFQAPNLCGTCHEVRGPGLLDEPTLSEFFAAPLEAGQTCTSCHDPHEAPGQVLLTKALALEVVDGAVVLTNVGAGHAVPTGMTAIRDVWVDVEVDGVLHERVIELGAELDASVFTESSFIRPRGLMRGASRRWLVPPGAGEVRASLHFSPVRAETARALGLEVEHRLLASERQAQ